MGFYMDLSKVVRSTKVFIRLKSIKENQVPDRQPTLFFLIGPLLAVDTQRSWGSVNKECIYFVLRVRERSPINVQGCDLTSSEPKSRSLFISIIF